MAITVSGIVRAWLRGNGDFDCGQSGFDGLCNSDFECGCGLVDLLRCDACPGDCEPAYHGPGPDGKAGWYYPAREQADAARAKLLKWVADPPGGER